MNEITLSVLGKSYKPLIRVALYDSLGTMSLEHISGIELRLNNDVILSEADWTTFYDEETSILIYPINELPEGDYVITATLSMKNGGEISQQQSHRVTIPSTYQETISTEEGSVSWSIDREGKLRIWGSGNISEAVTEPWVIPWHSFRHRVTSAWIELTHVSELSYFFYDCRNLVKVEIPLLRMKDAVSMNSMFALCESLEELDMKYINLGSVTSADDFLVSANSLKKIDTPRNLGVEIKLPQSKNGACWYDISGMVHKVLPQGRDTSIMLILGEKPETMTYKVTVRDKRPVFTVSFNEIILPWSEISEIILKIRKVGTSETSEPFEWKEVFWNRWKEFYDDESRTITYQSQEDYEPGEYESGITILLDEDKGNLTLTGEAGFTIEEDNLGEGGDDDGSGDGSGSGNDGPGSGNDGPGSGDDDGNGSEDGSGSGNDNGNGSGSGNDGPGSGDDDGNGSGDGSGSGNDGPGSADDDETGSGNDGPGTEITKGLWVTGIKAEYEYTGSAIRPDVKVYDGLGQLIEKKEYTVVHKNNKNAYEADDKGKKAPYVKSG